MSSPPMNPLLEQFLSEARDFLETAARNLMQLEDAPSDEGILNELFRCVHTLKGNSGLFTFPEMTRVLHAGEDLLGMVRSGHVGYSRELADRLLEAMDFVGMLCGEIEATERIDASRAGESQHMADALRKLMPALLPGDAEARTSAQNAGILPAPSNAVPAAAVRRAGLPQAICLPESVRTAALQQCRHGDPLHWIAYRPQRECFFHGDDPLNCARQTPGLMWGRVVVPGALPALAELDTYSCLVQFDLLSNATREELDQYYRYLPDQVEITAIDLPWLMGGQGEENLADDAPPPAPPPFSDEEWAALERILAAQRQILLLDDRPRWHAGRVRAVAEVLVNLSQAVGDSTARTDIELSLADALASGHNTLLLTWLDTYGNKSAASGRSNQSPASEETAAPRNEESAETNRVAETGAATAPVDDGIKFGRRAEDSLTGPRSLKVDQAKVDRLMNLIGELVVSKNALPYLAERAETQFGVRELAREIKGQYSVINRIADEMQDAIMQVRMMAVSFVFQRFPRLVRDLSRKLGKEVQLVLEGEQTEADKNIIQSLADPLIHIVRNSLDHGLEMPEVRLAAGKPATGKLTIRATQEADRVVIEIGDDGKGIDPAIIKKKAYEKGIIDEAMLERIGDQEAINLIFAAGFSTAEVISDLSGRGVGMDVVR